jgi:steroid 5-alpha reductase family enzyme
MQCFHLCIQVLSMLNIPSACRWGVFFVCAGGFSKAAQYASVASPVVVFLLLRYVSGVPILERQADRRWGPEPEYQAYKARVPVLFPTLGSIFGAGKAGKGDS